MNYSKRAFAVVYVLSAVFLSSLSLVVTTVTVHARDADRASLTFAAAQTAKQQCVNSCRVRNRSCLSLKQIPAPECRGIYQDCVRFTCSAG
jgi:hypothetical protein